MDYIESYISRPLPQTFFGVMQWRQNIYTGLVVVSIGNANYQSATLPEIDISSLFYNFLSAPLPKKLKICLVVSCSIYINRCCSFNCCRCYSFPLVPP